MKENQWISVKDQLPENEERVAILYKFNGRGNYRKFIGEYCPHDNEWRNLLNDIEITHWMPLPEDPEE